MCLIRKRKTILRRNLTVLAQDLQRLAQPLRIRPHPRLPDLLLRPMADQLEAKFAQMTVDANCPEVFVKWLAKSGILTMETYGRLAASEDKLDVKVDAKFTADGRKLDTIGQSSCIAKLWGACRAALCVDPSGAPRAGQPCPERRHK